jgi:protein gp37
MMASKIEWLARPGTVPESWNPLQDVRKGKSGRGYHCTKVSPGCENCWAEAMNRRFGNGFPFDDAPVEFELAGLDKPLRWRKPRTVAVQLMGDLFHEEVLFSSIWDIFDVMAYTPKHTYVVLTKRPDRMLAFLDEAGYLEREAFPLPPNIWGMVTVESQEQAWRASDLSKAPFVVRGVSIEPMLGAVDLCFPEPLMGNEHSYLGTDSVIDKLDWVIVGGESGPGARPMRPDWARGIRDQCSQAGVPFFFKQWGACIPEENAAGMWPEKASSDPIMSPSRIPAIHVWPGGSSSLRYSKKRNGRLLDGREWNEWPR